MRHHRPDAAELLRTVGSYIDTLPDVLGPSERYQLLVCRHILEIVRREAEAGPFHEEDEARLAAAIRAGACDESWDDIFDQVLARTISRVAIVRPSHLAPEHRRE